MTTAIPIIAIPGLGGHPSVFAGYGAAFPQSEFIALELIRPSETEETLLALIRKKGKVVILANCYGAQCALRAVQQVPAGSIERLIIIEPFFAQFFWWRKVALHSTRALLRATSSLGLKPRRFARDIDYAALARYPLFVQPVFDLLHQGVGEYLAKIEDILTFSLEGEIPVETLLIFSPGGYSQDEEKRAQVRAAFKNADIVQVGQRTHNIVSVSRNEVIEAIRNWYTPYYDIGHRTST